MSTQCSPKTHRHMNILSIHTENNMVLMSRGYNWENDLCVTQHHKLQCPKIITKWNPHTWRWRVTQACSRVRFPPHWCSPWVWSCCPSGKQTLASRAAQSDLDVGAGLMPGAHFKLLMSFLWASVCSLVAAVLCAAAAESVGVSFNASIWSLISFRLFFI